MSRPNIEFKPAIVLVSISDCASHPNIESMSVMAPVSQAATMAVGWQVDNRHYFQCYGAQLIPNNKDPSKVKSILERLLNNLNSKSCHLNCCQGNEIQG